MADRVQISVTQVPDNVQIGVDETRDIVTIAVSNEQGETGPQGPAGAMGPTGPQGPAPSGTGWVVVNNGVPSSTARIIEKTFRIAYPTALAAVAWFRAPVALWVTQLDVLVTGGTNVVCQLDEMDTNGANAVVCGADLTATAGTNAQTTVFTNDSIAAGNYVGFHITSVSGTPTSVLVTVRFSLDAP